MNNSCQTLHVTPLVTKIVAANGVEKTDGAQNSIYTFWIRVEKLDEYLKRSFLLNRCSYVRKCLFISETGMKSNMDSQVSLFEPFSR